MNGKGDKRRPMQISQEELDANWDAIFKQKPNEEMFDNMNLDPKDEKVKEDKEETKEE